MIRVCVFQNAPDIVDKPPLVPANLSKMDLPRLLNDIPKFKPWVSASNWAHWEEFVSSTDKLSQVHINSWDLHGLVSAAITSSTLPVPAVVNGELQRLLDKESIVPPKVNTELQ